jgi:hypothetical protein
VFDEFIAKGEELWTQSWLNSLLTGWLREET